MKLIHEGMFIFIVFFTALFSSLNSMTKNQGVHHTCMVQEEIRKMFHSHSAGLLLKKAEIVTKI
jgi:hypothetical protein